MSTDNYEEKYTKPDLRRKLKQEIEESERGGKPGEWSARKSQLLVQEYEKKGGGYKKDKKDEDAKSLEEWGEQEWQTVDGKKAIQEDKTKRYLPKAVWERLSEEEKKAAEESKKKASKDGQQFVDWTPAIKRAMAKEGYIDGKDDKTKDEYYEMAQDLEIEGRSDMSKQELRSAIAQQQEKKLADCTSDELYEKAKKLDIGGRSNMDKSELIKSIVQARLAS